jgi:hypothetical protein
VHDEAGPTRKDHPMLSVRHGIVMLLVGGLAAGCAAQSGGRLSPPATSDEIMSLSMMHGLGMVAYGYGQEASDPATQLTCDGSGADRAHAVQMSSAHGKGQIKDVFPCLQQLYPNGQSGMQAFVIEGGRYYTVAHLKDSTGQEREVFFDITQWAEDFVREMRAKS